MPPLGLEYEHSPSSSVEVTGSVGILTSLRAGRSRNSGSMLGKDKVFSTWFTLTRVPPGFLFSGYWRLPSKAEVKNTWSCTSSTAYAFRIEG